MTVSPITRRALEEIAAQRLDGGLLGPFMLGQDEVPLLAKGVYIAYAADHACLYVGKVASELDRGRLRVRIGEHLRNLRKLNAWNELYVLPLKASTSNAGVEKVEGFVSMHLLPVMSRRSPNPLRRRG